MGFEYLAAGHKVTLNIYTYKSSKFSCSKLLDEKTCITIFLNCFNEDQKTCVVLLINN